MKKLYSAGKILVLVMLMFSGVKAQVINEWLSYYEPNYGFGIDFPKAPDHSYDTLEIAAGHLYAKVIDLIVPENEDYNSEYRIYAAPFPFDMSEKENQDKISSLFNDFAERYVVQDGCAIVSKSSTKVDLMYEMNLNLACNTDHSIRTISLIVVNDYFYMLEVYTNEFKAPNKHISKFLKSFKPFMSHY